MLNTKFPHNHQCRVGERYSRVRAFEATEKVIKLEVGYVNNQYSPQALEHKPFDAGRLAWGGNLSKYDDAKEILAVADLAHVEREVEYPTVLLHDLREMLDTKIEIL